MTLLIDVGNTRIKWGLMGDDRVNYGGSFFYKQEPLEEMFAVHWGLLSVDRVVISNVGGKTIGQCLTAWFLTNKKIEPLFLFAEKEAMGLTFAYTQAKTFGMDRFFAMLACWQEFNSAFVLLGCGSATTFDAVTEAGQHLGSLIAPGLYLQHAAMAGLANCAIPAELAAREHAFGKSTAEAITQGALQLIAGFFNFQQQEMKKQIHTNIQYVITGGDAEAIQPFLTFPVHYRPHIVLEGLRVFLLNENRE